ncbi:KH homology domain-containing protein 4-like isoform X4 [Narcine bancroftii]|uniref:KH homology domain-containing protein 4-like isoform X4 n=1 Tax=Narcine bancroftii TaxID=1343680 RepID=UPI003831D417
MSAESPQTVGRRSKWDCPESVPVSLESQMNNFSVTMPQGGGLPGSATASHSSQSSSDALDAASAAAARINAMLMAKGKLKLPQTPSNRSKSSKSSSHQKNKDDMVVAEIEINDVPIVCRNLLTRGHTQDEINKISGAAVSTRGRFMNEDEKQMALQGDRPLYLCIQAQTQKSVDRAVNRIKEIIGEALAKEAIKQPLPQVVTSTARSSPMTTHNSPFSTLPQLQPGMHFVQDKIFVGLEHAPPNFNAKEKVEGPGGSFLQHIQNETGAKVHLRGKGSGFIEPTSGREAFEPMYIYITHPKPEGLASAKTLCENLLQTVYAEYTRYQSQITTGIGPPSVYSMVTPSPGIGPAQNPISVLPPVMTSQPYPIQPQTSVPYTFANTNAQFTTQQFRQPLPTSYTTGMPTEMSQNQVVSGIVNQGSQNNFQMPQQMTGPCYTPQPLQQAGTSLQQHGPFHLTNLGTRSSQDMGSGMKIAADSILFGRGRERQLMPLLSNHGDHSEMPKTSMHMLRPLNMQVTFEENNFRQGHMSPSHKRHKTSDSLCALAQYGEDSSDEEDDRHKRGGRYRTSGNASRNMYHPYFQHSIHRPPPPHHHRQQQQHGIPRSQNSMPFWMAPN